MKHGANDLRSTLDAKCQACLPGFQRRSDERGAGAALILGRVQRKVLLTELCSSRISPVQSNAIKSHVVERALMLFSRQDRDLHLRWR
jgi:hypothetical protein